jgi:hypothetical protein
LFFWTFLSRMGRRLTIKIQKFTYKGKQECTYVQYSMYIYLREYTRTVQRETQLFRPHDVSDPLICSAILG